jgi:hypothetical protein
VGSLHLFLFIVLPTAFLASEVFDAVSGFLKYGFHVVLM